MGIGKIFSVSYGPSMFSAVMSRDCFAFILHNLSFDDESTRAERWKKDRFTEIREFFETFNNQCMLVLVPDEYLSIDETLYPMRAQISFKQLYIQQEIDSFVTIKKVKCHFLTIKLSNFIV